MRYQAHHSMLIMMIMMIILIIRSTTMDMVATMGRTMERILGTMMVSSLSNVITIIVFIFIITIIISTPKWEVRGCLTVG